MAAMELTWRIDGEMVYADLNRLRFVAATPA